MLSLPAWLAKLAGTQAATRLIAYLQTAGVIAETIDTIEDLWEAVSGDTEILAVIYKYLTTMLSEDEIDYYDVEFGSFLLDRFNDPRVEELVRAQRKRIQASRDRRSDIRESDQPLLAAEHVESQLATVCKLTRCRSTEEAYELISIFKTVDLDDARLVIERDRERSREKKRRYYGPKGQGLNWFN